MHELYLATALEALLHLQSIPFLWEQHGGETKYCTAASLFLQTLKEKEKNDKRSQNRTEE